MSKVHETLARLADTAAKLLHETQRLRRDVGILHGRISPFSDEVPPRSESGAIERPKRWDVRDVIEMLDGSRRSIGNSERELAAIRSMLETIQNDVVSRDDFKPWLKK